MKFPLILSFCLVSILQVASAKVDFRFRECVIKAVTVSNDVIQFNASGTGQILLTGSDGIENFQAVSFNSLPVEIDSRIFGSYSPKGPLTWKAIVKNGYFLQKLKGSISMDLAGSQITIREGNITTISAAVFQLIAIKDIGK